MQARDVVTGGIADDIFVSARQGIEAWVAAVNANGGLAGREVQLFPLDSGVVNHGSRMETLCEPGSSVLALVGSLSLLDGDGLEILQDPNCRIPDFPALANSPARRDSNLTFLTNPQRNLFYDVSTLQHIADQIRALDPQAVLRVSDMQVDQETFTVRNQRMKEAARNIGFSTGVSYSSSNGQSVENQARALLEFEIPLLVPGLVDAVGIPIYKAAFEGLLLAPPESPGLRAGEPRAILVDHRRRIG